MFNKVFEPGRKMDQKVHFLVQNAILREMDPKKYQETTVPAVKWARETLKMHFLDNKSLFGPKVTFGTKK